MCERVYICFTWNINPRRPDWVTAPVVAVAAVVMSGGMICIPRPRFCDRYTWRAGVSYNLTNCTNTKSTAFHQYFTPLQFNALKSRGGFTSSNRRQTRRTVGWVLLTLPPHPSDNPILKFGNIPIPSSSPISSDLRIWVTSDFQTRLSSHLKTGKSEF